MKLFKDIKKGEVLIKDDDSFFIYIVDEVGKKYIVFTYIKYYIDTDRIDIGDGIVFDQQTWDKNDFAFRFNNLTNLKENVQKQIISKLLSDRLEWV